MARTRVKRTWKRVFKAAVVSFSCPRVVVALRRLRLRRMYRFVRLSIPLVRRGTMVSRR